MQMSVVDRNVRSSGMGEAIPFGIDEQEFGFITGILSDKLYSDKTAAIIREYCANAIDANIEFNATRNVLITPPTRFDPIFKVRDFGEGLSRYDIENVYVKFGKSTKRNTNRLVGVFGLGAKSGFSYADSFNVISWHKGICSSYTAQKMSDGKLSLIHISDVPSDEPSGIEISIAVEEYEINTFNSKIREFCKYCSMKFDFATEFAVPEVEYHCNFDKFFIEKTSGYGYHPCKVICGNVVYPLDINQLNKDFHDMRGVVLRAEIGAVDVNPNRESLEYSVKTKDFLNNLFTEIVDTVKADTQKKIDEQVFPWTVYQFITALNSSFGGSVEIKTSNFTFKGRPIKHTKDVKAYSRDQGKFYSSVRIIDLSNITEDTLLVVAQEDTRVIPSRLALGYFQKYGVNPSKIIVSDSQEVFDNLFCDSWKPEQIVRDYKAMWSKIGARGPNVIDPNTYVYKDRRKYRKVLLKDVPADSKIFVQVCNRGLDYVDFEDSQYAQAAQQLGMTYYAIKKNKIKNLDNTWIPLKDAVLKEIAAKVGAVDSDDHFLVKELAEVNNIEDVVSFVQKHRKELIAAGETEAVLAVEKYFKEKDAAKTVNPFLTSLLEKSGTKIVHQKSQKVESKINAVKALRKKYELAVLIYDSCGWRTDCFKTPVDNYIKLLNSVDKNAAT